MRRPSPDPADELVQLPDSRPRPAATPHGRGAVGNPRNRFERLEVEVDDEVAPEDAVSNYGAAPDRVPTEVLRDTSRSIIATNDSPDIPFDASINPYRGCEHGCAYCMDGETPILMADGSSKALASLQVGDEIYGTRREGWYRRLVRTRVLAHWETTKPAFEIELADGTRLVASGDHRFLSDRGWKFVTGAQQGAERRPHLTLRNKLMGFGRFARPVGLDARDYRQGYLCGIVRGDGHLASYEYEREGRAHGNQHQFRLALIDTEALNRTRRYLGSFGVPVHRFVFQEATDGRQRLEGIRTHSESSVDRIRSLLAWPIDPSSSWRRGFLAGIYDAEGSYSGSILRISNTDLENIDWISSSLDSLQLRFAMETQRRGRSKPVHAVRLLGGLAACLGFWQCVGTAIPRKRDVEGMAIKSTARLGIRSIRPLERMRLFDITTGTGDFIADGVVSHNCYARPSHEYLGFSAGLDFESRILVKEDAAALLRRELTSPRWQPKTLALSGVTDPYQPVERKLGVTRGCLEVLAEVRNPVAVITKSGLVTRDADLLAELAAHGAVRVALSVTSLDVELARKLEPRAASPEARLRAIGELAEAGIPVSVMVAPVIPGLTDHEIPAILQAAADAGADSAGYIPLRLPGAVAPLFAGWLEAHFPERREKVLNRVRGMRGGRLNDPRFGNRMRGEGVFADQIRSLFTAARKRAGLARRGEPLSGAAFRRKGVDQMDLFP